MRWHGDDAWCARIGARREAVRAVFYILRDLRYVGGAFEDLEIYRASRVLAAGHGYCVGKASLCTALARAAGIPARLGFADVRNHLAPRAATGQDETRRQPAWWRPGRQI